MTDGNPATTANSFLSLELATILDHLTDGVTVQDLQGQVIYANATAAQLCGFASAAAFLAASGEERFQHFEIVTAAGQPFAIDQLPGRRALRGEAAAEQIIELRRRADGAQRWHHVKAIPIASPQGEPQYAVNIIRDVTAQQNLAHGHDQLLQQITAERSQFEAILRGMPVGMAIAAAPSGQLLFGNDQMAMIWRHPVLEVATIGEYDRYKGFHSDGRPYAPQDWPLARTISTGEVVINEEALILRGDGTYATIQINATPIRDSAGQISAGVVTFSDISARKEAEVQIRSLLSREQAARKEAELAQQRLAFLAEASRALSASLEYDATLATVAHLTVPQFADFCTIHLIDASGAIKLVEAVHVDPAKAALIRELNQRYPADISQPDAWVTMVARGESLLVEDIPQSLLDQLANNPETRAYLEALQPVSGIMVPLQSRGRTIGVLSLSHAESRRRYTSDDLSLMTDLAQRAATAVDNARLYHDAQAALAARELAVWEHQQIEERLGLLIQAATSLLSTLQFDEVLRALLDLAQRLIAADAYALWRADPQLPHWRVAHSQGLSREYEQRIAPLMGDMRAMIEQPSLIEDIEQVPALAHRRALYRSEGIRSLLVFPLRIRSQSSGTLVFYYRQPHQFSELEVRVGTALSNMAAAAITTTELYGEQQQLRRAAEAAHDEKAFLAEASAVLSFSLDYNTTLNALARLVVPRLADWCGIHMLDPHGQLTTLAVVHRDPAQLELASRLERRYAGPDAQGRGPMRVIRSGQPLIVPEMTEALRQSVAQDAEHLEILRRLDLASCLLVPLISRAGAIGVISFGRSADSPPYSEADLPLAAELAHRAAIAVDNARLYQEAQEAIRLREQFLSIASHELKTPLTSVLGFLDLFQRRTAREGTLSEREQRTLRLIREQAGRLDSLVTALLDISRIETGQLHLERQPLDVVALLRQLVEALQSTLEQHDLRYAGADGPLLIDGDPLRLEQVLHNLLSNAVKYSPGGGTITLAARAQADQIAISVSDQGIGMPQEALNGLFNRFYRAPNVNAYQISGMGIGLFIVREIVALHGGSVQVESVEGQGSTFTITLPLIA